MSRQDQLRFPSPPTDSEEIGGNDILLQINLRLRLNEVADMEAEQLRHSVRRPPTDKELYRLAGKIYDARRARDRVLDGSLFGEPAWDMLLALYYFPSRGEFLSATSLSHAAHVPETTGHRWRAILTKENLLERGPDGVDARRQFVRLTAKGKGLMHDYLTRLFFCESSVSTDRVIISR